MTSVYFEEAFVKGANKYVLSIYEDSLMVKKIQEKDQRYPAFFSDPLSWERTYYWEINALSQTNELISGSGIRKFYIAQKIRSVSVIDQRLKVIKNTSIRSNTELIVLDYARAIFDRQGNQIWSLPEIPGVITDRSQVRDLRVTDDRTLTFLSDNVPVEIDFEGNILWKAPSPFVLGKDTITFHHDFKKTKQGHYQVLGNRKVNRKIHGNYRLEDFKNDPFVFQINDTLYKKIQHGLLMEFGSKGKLVWHWDSGPYLADADLTVKKREDGLPSFGAHMNAFSVNQTNTRAYVGFRDISRVVSIDLKSKKVIAAYGENLNSDDSVCPAEFRGQHDATITDRNTLLIFNNNNQGGNSGPSSVLEYKMDADCSEELRIWKFGLDFDSLTKGASATAGNVDELVNGNLLVCGGGLPRVFEVTRKHEIAWDAFIEGKYRSDSSWNYFPQYRAHWTSRLYHFHFLVNISIQKNGVAVEVINTGTTHDKYKVDVLNAGNVQTSKLTQELEPGNRSELKFKLTKGAEFHLRVTPVSGRTTPKKIALIL